jgi:hypothetical protein
MRISENTVLCDGCGLEFHWPPLAEGEAKYCCADCRDGYECSCHEMALVEDDFAYSESNAVSIFEGY